MLPQLLALVPAAHVARLRRGLGCVWPRMLWLAPGLYPHATDSDPTLVAARPHDAFETTMRTLRRRLKLGGGVGDSAASEAEPWRAAVESCLVEDGDEAAFDLGALRRQVRAETPTLSQDAKDMESHVPNCHVPEKEVDE